MPSYSPKEGKVIANHGNERFGATNKRFATPNETTTVLPKSLLPSRTLAKVNKQASCNQTLHLAKRKAAIEVLHFWTERDFEHYEEQWLCDVSISLENKNAVVKTSASMSDDANVSKSDSRRRLHVKKDGGHASTQQSLVAAHGR